MRLAAAEDLQEDGLELVAEGAVDQDVDGRVDRHQEVGHLEPDVVVDGAICSGNSSHLKCSQSPGGVV